MPLDITLTDAGIAEIVNAVNTGTDPVLVAEIGLGTGEYTPLATQTAMVAETKRLTTFGGTVVADDTIHVLIKDESSDAYNVSEIGLFTDSGTLLGIYSQVGDVMQKTTLSSLLLAVDIKLASISAASLTFGDLNFTNPPASTTVQGVVELADSAEMAAGADPNRVPPVDVVAAYVAALGALKANTSHNHDAANIVSGLLAAARLPAPTATARGGHKKATFSGASNGRLKDNETGFILAWAQGANQAVSGEQVITLGSAFPTAHVKTFVANIYATAGQSGGYAFLSATASQITVARNTLDNGLGVTPIVFSVGY